MLDNISIRRGPDGSPLHLYPVTSGSMVFEYHLSKKTPLSIWKSLVKAINAHDELSLRKKLADKGTQPYINTILVWPPPLTFRDGPGLLLGALGIGVALGISIILLPITLSSCHK